MQAFLGGAGVTGRPRTIDHKTQPHPDDAQVTSSLGRGEVFLRDRGGGVARLVWTEDDPQPARSVLAGDYALLGYRVQRGEWFVSATGGKRKVALQERGATRLDVDPRIHVRVRARWRGRKLALSVAITGQDGLGLTIYRQGKRVPLRWVLEDGAGEALAQGAMRYG